MENNRAVESSTFTVHPDTHIGHLHLRVSNIERSLRYYRDLLGFQILGEASDRKAFLAVNSHRTYLLALSRASDPRTSERHAGLYHFAILLPDRKNLASLLRHLMKHMEESNIEGAADHGVSEAIYLHDPDEEALHHLLRNLSWKAVSTEKSPEAEFSHSVFIYDPDGTKIQLHLG